MGNTKSKVSLFVASILFYTGSSLANDSNPATPNGGKAADVVSTAGAVAGAVLGGWAGEAVAGPKGGLAGGVLGEKAGNALGEQAGRVLDEHAAENQRSGRGGSDDPRYDPATLFSH